MSFSAKVKGEICRYTDISKEEALAEISAIMKGSGTIGFSGRGLSFKITTENPASARHIFTILKEYFDISFVNRIDSIIEFNNLSLDNIKYLINKKINKLKHKYNKL